MPNDLKTCQKCQTYNIQSAKFCNRCGSRLMPFVPIIDIEEEFSTPTRAHTSSLDPFDSFLTTEVRRNKEIQRIKDRPGGSSSSVPSAFGIDPKSTVGMHKQQVELWICEKGDFPQRLPNSYTINYGILTWKRELTTLITARHLDHLSAITPHHIKTSSNYQNLNTSKIQLPK